jgi:hypothetical protein
MYVCMSVCACVRTCVCAYMFVGMCACVRACVYVCVRGWMGGCECVGVLRLHVRACVCAYMRI